MTDQPFVLLIACANVANLLLARAAGRRREVAVRAALGAGRWRIVRQLLTESMLLAVLGGALGVLLAWWGLRLLVDLSPANIPRLENIRLDGRVLWFSLGLSLLTGLIFGLVRDTKRQGVDQPIRIESWMPLAQSPAGSMDVVLRTIGDPLALSNSAREAVWSLDRDLPIPRIQTMEQNLSARVAQRRLNMLLLGLFASVALILAAVGIYGVMSYAVTQRTNEIGIRMALGAQASDVVGLVLKHGMALTLVGVAIGLIATFMLTRLMASLLFGVSATDPITFAAIAALLIGVALVACWIPARRATRVDPMVALRCE